MIKAVLFDLDGTLANSLQDLADATNFALAKGGFPARELGEFNYFVGDGMPKMVERAIPEGKATPELVSQLLKFCLEYYAVHYVDNTYAYEGCVELVNTLKQRGIIVAVVTNKAQEMADIVVKKLYGDAFDLIFGKRDGLPAKPDPTATLMAMKELGVKPEECVFIGDSGVDVKTGVNSGAVSVGELWGYRGREELIGNGAQYIIQKPQELIDIIDSIS